MAAGSREDWAFTVAEAMPKDAGRGLARLDPKDMAALGLQAGDIVELVAKRATGARVIPSYPEDRAKSCVQIDGITRENAQVGLGEVLEVRPTAFTEATVLVLAPTTASRGFVSSKDAKYLARILEGLPVTSGDRVRATLLGGRYQEFTVGEIRPKGIVVVGPGTHIKLTGNGAPASGKNGATYEDVGGLRRELQKIREMIELPLKHPELFERLGIDAPKGVLLHGPPGCGKTLIARAIANEADAAFFQVSGPEVIHKFYGESEAHLRAIFDKASEKAPAIVFIDEIDAIAGKRDEVRGDQQVERRVVAQLLALMDGLKGRGQVIVIGATNIPHTLDPALRRPGRFDRELSISVPDKSGRLEILHIHTRGMPLAPDVSLERLAEITHGFVGADLEALAREAAMVTLRRIVSDGQLDGGSVPYDALSTLEISMENFLQALNEVEPSAIREVFTEIPEVGWDDVGGLEEAKRVLMETIEWPVKYADLFRRAGTRQAKGVLLTGSPGTGKTLLAKAVATQSGVNFISVKGPALLSRWVGDSEKGIREVFKKARQASPCILFFDEIDALVPSRGLSGDSQVTERVVSQFLTELDGVEDLQGVTVLAATNRPDMLDAALLRAGRFDIHVALPKPDAAARRAIFEVHTRGKPTAADVAFDEFVEQTDGMTGADIESICRHASLIAMREFINTHAMASGLSAVDSFRVTAEHFQQAVEERSRQLS